MKKLEAIKKRKQERMIFYIRDDDHAEDDGTQILEDLLNDDNWEIDRINDVIDPRDADNYSHTVYSIYHLKRWVSVSE